MLCVSVHRDSAEEPAAEKRPFGHSSHTDDEIAPIFRVFVDAAFFAGRNSCTPVLLRYVPAGQS